MESHGQRPKTNFGPQCMHQISWCFNRESQGYVSWFWDVWGVRTSLSLTNTDDMAVGGVARRG